MLSCMRLQPAVAWHCQVTAAAPYPGGFPELGPPLVHSQGVDYRFKEAYSAAKMILEGAPSAGGVASSGFV
jgi:hypothetical protein